jgi:hypothetical protein
MRDNKNHFYQAVLALLNLMIQKVEEEKKKNGARL